MRTEKPQRAKQTELLKQPNGLDIPILSHLITALQIGGKMSEQGADKAGLTISQGLKFFFVSLGFGLAMALIFYFLPFLAEFINALRNG